MDIGGILDLWRHGLEIAALVGAPFLVSALAIGLVISLVQAATQMQEQVLTFAPKIVVVGLVFALAGSWVLERLMQYTTEAITSTVEIGRGRP
jgi:flagellar biosynthetic protein FliQ